MYPPFSQLFSCTGGGIVSQVPIERDGLDGASEGGEKGEEDGG